MRAINADVFSLIALSYAQGLLPFFPSQIIGAPDWTRTARFDIIAKVSDELAAGDPLGLSAKLPMLLRTLLEDRFKLRVLHEQREQPIYILQLVKKNKWKIPASIEPEREVRTISGGLYKRAFSTTG